MRESATAEAIWGARGNEKVANQGELDKVIEACQEMSAWPPRKVEIYWQEYSRTQTSAYLHPTARTLAGFRQWMGLSTGRLCPFCGSSPHHKSCNHAIPATLDVAAAVAQDQRQKVIDVEKARRLNESNARLQDALKP